jgi:ankyrin repeat protein
MVRKRIRFLFILFALFDIASAGDVLVSHKDIDTFSLIDFSLMNKDFKLTPVMNAAVVNDVKAIEVFILSGANINAKNFSGVTALHLAVRNSYFDTAEVLLKNGALVNVKDNDGWTPLMRASLNGDSKIVKLLLDNGSNVWTTNNSGDSAIIHATISGSLDSAKYLMSYYNCTNFQKKELKKALNLSIRKYNKPFMDLFKGATCDVNVSNKISTPSNEKKNTDNTNNVNGVVNVTDAVIINNVNVADSVNNNEKLELGVEEQQKTKTIPWYKRLFSSKKNESLENTKEKEKDIETEVIKEENVNSSPNENAKDNAKDIIISDKSTDDLIVEKVEKNDDIAKNDDGHETINENNESVNNIPWYKKIWYKITGKSNNNLKAEKDATEEDIVSHSNEIAINSKGNTDDVDVEYIIKYLFMGLIKTEEQVRFESRGFVVVSHEDKNILKSNIGNTNVNINNNTNTQKTLTLRKVKSFEIPLINDNNIIEKNNTNNVSNTNTQKTLGFRKVKSFEVPSINNDTINEIKKEQKRNNYVLKKGVENKIKPNFSAKSIKEIEREQKNIYAIDNSVKKDITSNIKKSPFKTIKSSDIPKTLINDDDKDGYKNRYGVIKIEPSKPQIAKQLKLEKETNVEIQALSQQQNPPILLKDNNSSSDIKTIDVADIKNDKVINIKESGVVEQIDTTTDLDLSLEFLDDIVIVKSDLYNDKQPVIRAQEQDYTIPVDNNIKNSNNKTPTDATLPTQPSDLLLQDMQQLNVPLDIDIDTQQ